MTVSAGPAQALTYGVSCDVAEGSVAASATVNMLDGPPNGATVLAGTPVTFSGEFLQQALTFSVASSPTLLSTPDIDGGPGSLQPGASLYTFTSAKATATPRTIYWEASFTFTPEPCEEPSTFTSSVRTLTVVSPQPSEAEVAKKREEEAAAKRRQEEAEDGVSLDGPTIDVQGTHHAAATLNCRGTATCSGELTLTAKRTTRTGKRAHAEAETIGTGAFSIAAGGTAKVKLTLDKAGRVLINTAHGHLNATLTILETSPFSRETRVQSVRLEQQNAPKAKKSKR